MSQKAARLGDKTDGDFEPRWDLKGFYSWLDLSIAWICVWGDQKSEQIWKKKGKLLVSRFYTRKRNSANDVVQLAEWDIYAYGPFWFFLNTDIYKVLHLAFYDLNTFQEGLKMEIDERD